VQRELPDSNSLLLFLVMPILVIIEYAFSVKSDLFATFFWKVRDRGTTDFYFALLA